MTGEKQLFLDKICKQEAKIFILFENSSLINIIIDLPRWEIFSTCSSEHIITDHNTYKMHQNGEAEAPALQICRAMQSVCIVDAGLGSFQTKFETCLNCSFFVSTPNARSFRACLRTEVTDVESCNPICKISVLSKFCAIVHTCQDTEWMV